MFSRSYTHLSYELGLESLPSELLVLIQIKLGNPIIYGRVQRANKNFYTKLRGSSTAEYWQFLLKRDFSSLRLPQGFIDYRQCYIEQFNARKQRNRLEPHQERLFNYIRWDHSEGIMWQDYLVGDVTSTCQRNDLLDVWQDDLNAVLVASQYGRKKILKDIYQYVQTTLFSNGNRSALSYRNQLYYAVKCGLFEEVFGLLSERYDDEDSFEGSSLHIAACHGYNPIIFLLIGAGADVLYERPFFKTTPLYKAAEYGHYETVKLLLAAAARIDQEDYYGITPLYIAAHEGHANVVKCLIDAGASIDHAIGDVDEKNLFFHGPTKLFSIDSGSTPLLIAAQKGYVEIVKLLKDARANIGKANRNKVTPLQKATGNGHAEVVKLLLSAKSCSKETIDEENLLCIAAENGHTDIVKILVDLEANIDKSNESGLTPLFIAAKDGKAEMVMILLQAGATIEAIDDMTPLYKAAQNGHLLVIELLLCAGADINYTLSDGSTALHVAAYEGEIDVVELLLIRGGTMLSDNKGKTPKMLAEESGHYAVALLLSLWEVKLNHKGTPLRKQVIEILKTPHNGILTSLATKMLFFRQERSIIGMIAQLSCNTEYEESDYLKTLLIAKQAEISVEKFSFIMKYILCDREQPFNSDVHLLKRKL